MKTSYHGITQNQSLATHIGILLLLWQDLSLIEDWGHQLRLRRLGINGLLLRLLVLAEGTHDLNFSPFTGGGLLFGA
ncbi:MAG: hypothetical protein VXU46_04765 [Planctomycetota bacterium]|nr:hypothetical protein [Planctomycetota bacterium]